MKYKVAVYSADYLLLLEFMEQVERQLIQSDISVFCPESLEDEFSGSFNDFVNTDLSKLKDYDILILLSEPQEKSSYIDNFDGTIIDGFGYKFSTDAEVHRVDEPIRAILKNIAVPVENTSVVLQLPACIFGKSGVEDLMMQTKDIFSFSNSESLVFNDRIAFNIHFNPMNLVGLPVGKTVDDFADALGDISIRIIPLSTVFTLDINATDIFDLKSDDGYIVPSGFFTASDLSEHREIFTMRRRNGFTFTGDYIGIFVESLVNTYKEVIG